MNYRTHAENPPKASSISNRPIAQPPNCKERSKPFPDHFPFSGFTASHRSKFVLHVAGLGMVCGMLDWLRRFGGMRLRVPAKKKQGYEESHDVSHRHVPTAPEPSANRFCGGKKVGDRHASRRSKPDHRS